MKHNGNIELVGGQILNLVGESLASDPTFDAAEEGRMFYNTATKEYKFNNGTDYVAFETDIVSASTTLRASLGTEWVNTDFSFNPTTLNTLSNISGLTSNSSLYDVIDQLNTGIDTALTVTKLQGIDLDFTGGLATGNIIYYNGSSFVSGTINDVDLVDISLSQINDVNLTSIANNEIAVYQNSEWVNKPLAFQYQELSGLTNTFAIAHNLGVQFCDVTIIDMDTATPSRIDPALVTTVNYDDANNLTVTLTGNKRVTIVVQGLGLV